MIKLSVIVAVYNGEKYIEECVESILGCDVEKYELIIIDDGSTDNTKKIIDRFKDNRIKYVFEENRGLRGARIRALEESSGEYIAFVDADDWIDGLFLGYSVGVMDEDESIDICSSTIVRVTRDGKREDVYQSKELLLDCDEARKRMMEAENYKWELCSKVYRRALFTDGVPDCDIRMFEDLDWNWVLFSRARRFFHTDKYRYYYRVVNDSMTHNYNRLNLTQLDVYDTVFRDNCDYTENIIKKYIGDYVKTVLRIILEATTEIVFDLDDGTAFDCIKVNRQRYLWAHPYFGESICINKELDDAIVSSDNECCNYYMNLVRENHRLINNLKNEGTCVAIYGAGIVAEYYTRWSKCYSIDTDYYIVSDGYEKPDLFIGKPVLYLSEIDKNRHSIIIATCPRIQNEVIQVLEGRGIMEYCAPNNCVFIE